MVDRYDRSSKEAMKIVKQVFKGKQGKQYRKDLASYLTTPMPLTSAYKQAEGFVPQVGPQLQQALDYQNSVLPAATQAVNQGLAGNFFDIGPWQQYAERNLRRETIPNIANTFSMLGTPLSSDTTGQITNATRDTYLDLAT